MLIRHHLTSGQVMSDLGYTAANLKSHWDDWFARSTIDDVAAWKNTSEYKFALTEAMLKTKPYRVHGMFWKLGQWEISKDNHQTQWIDTKTELRSHSDTLHNILEDNDTKLIQLGFNTLPAEEFITQDSKSNDLADTLASLNMEFLLHLSGFTDKNIMRIQIDGNYDRPRQTLSDKDYDIFMEQNAPIREVFFSGVKITVVDMGYIVSGYDYDKQYFCYRPVIETGKKILDTVENTTITRYLNVDTATATKKYDDETSPFAKRQDLYNFLVSLGYHYESIGFRIQDQWIAKAKDVIKWSMDASVGDTMTMNGFDETLIYEQGPHGIIQDMGINYDGFPTIIDGNRKPIRSKDILTLRGETTTEFTHNQIHGLKLSLVEFEHMLVFRNSTTLDDNLYVPEQGFFQSKIKLEGERTRNWNGRVEAPGYLIRNDGLILNMESSVREIEHDWLSSESKILNRLTRQAIGNNVGYMKPTYLQNTFIGDIAAYRFEKGRRKYKGTETSLKAIGRNRNIFGKEFDCGVYEEWMIRIGEYGDLSENNPLQFMVKPEKIKNDPQHFQFNQKFTVDYPDDSIINLYDGAHDAISGNYDSPFDRHPIFRADATNLDLDAFDRFNRDSGLPLLDEVDYYINSIDDIRSVYDPTQPYALIPNWNGTRIYAKGDIVRRNGKVYQLLITTTGLASIHSDIVVRGTQVYPNAPYNSYISLNDNTITFRKTTTESELELISIFSDNARPEVPSGRRLVIDGSSVEFIKTESSVNYGDIEISGSEINPTVQHSATRSFTIYYANDGTTSVANMSSIAIVFNEIENDMKSMEMIWKEALVEAGLSTSNAESETTTRLTALEALRSAYITANSTGDWETFIGDYHDMSANPREFLNPEYIATNLHADWTTEGRNLIDADLQLIAALTGRSATEDVDSIVAATLNDATQFATDLEEANDVLDSGDPYGSNLVGWVNYIEDNGGTSISASNELTASVPTDYLEEGLSDIVDRINDVIDAHSETVNIEASAENNRLVISRTDNNINYRLGVSVDDELGFDINDRNYVAQTLTTTVGIDLNLEEIVDTINDFFLPGVTASAQNNRLNLQSTNATLTLGSESTALSDLGFSAGTRNAGVSTDIIETESSINDIVEAINNANIDELEAEQVEGRLLLTYTGTTFEIGEGTANNEIGLIPQEIQSETETVQNEFEENDWQQIVDPAHFSIWVINNIGATTTTIVNREDVYQTLDFNLAITDVCVGTGQGDDALVTTNTSHNLSEGEYVLILGTNSSPNIDGIHQITGIVNDDSFLIDQFIETESNSGTLFPIRSVRFSTLEEANQSLNGVRDGDYIYIDRKSDDENFGAVYKVQIKGESIRLRFVRDEKGKTNNSILRNGILFSPYSNKVTKRFEVFDPLKGIIPGIAERELDIRSDIDLGCI